MIFHLVPRVYNPYSNITDVKIKSISIPDYNINISERELNQGRPMPNKNYVIGMLKDGRKAMDGLLISLPDQGQCKFNVEILWKMKVNEEEVYLTHEIINHIEGGVSKDKDLISQEAVLWYGYKDFKVIWPEQHLHQSPMEIHPVLHLEKNGLRNHTDEIYMPVLERDRIYTGMLDRIPEKIWMKATA